MSPIVRIQNVTHRFGDVLAVDDLSLDIDRAELFCLLGASGCGKTTLLRMLAGFERVDSGRIEIDGIDMADVPPARGRSTSCSRITLCFRTCLWPTT